MPLRDHFRPPLDEIASWEELHGQWPAIIVQHLRKQLPDGYVAGPRVHSGSQVEIDVAAFEKDDPSSTNGMSETNGGVATAVWAPAAASLAVETDLPDFDEYEVRIYDAKRGRHLVAAIEIVSPANKDRPEHRNAFVGKCAALVQKGVAVSIVDLVTVRRFNLYADMLAFLGHTDPTLSDPPTDIYAASCRWVKKEKRTVLEAWSHVLTVGQPLPTLPLWLTADLVVPLALEQSYEQACHDLWIIT
ncbi:MAG: DUF4058 family protein [Planctomycetes bacterium]|nr:DUF4058 family protein [Planctomycetota bacterium]